MSGGVDSSVAALLLRRAGYRVIGVTLRLWDDPCAASERTCCSSEAVERAAAVARALEMPHYTLDARETFSERVVTYFVDEYARGRTPNPCMKCNATVRFGLMLDMAARLGLERVATGHYARLAGDPPSLTRGVDQKKDQSYVLAEVSPCVLRRMVFPLGELRKSQVRRIAAEAGLVGASQPESQEICFIPDNDHQSFLAARLGERPGLIVDTAGREIGSHHGTYNYTICQRKGLRISGPQPKYVVAIDAEARTVAIGDHQEMGVAGITLAGVVYHRSPGFDEVTVQYRSSGGRVRGRVADPEHVAFAEPAFGVAPGQTAVLYDGDAVLAAGTIAETAATTHQRATSGPK